jgi:hypothetical protein
LKIEEESWSTRGRCSALELKVATTSSIMVLPLKDLSFVLVSSKGCKVQRRDFKLHSDRFSALTFSLLALHHHRHNETTMHRILVLWDRATIALRMGTMLTGVQEAGKSDSSSRYKSKSQLQCQLQCNYPIKAESSSCSCELCGNGRCSSSFGHYHWYDPYR